MQERSNVTLSVIPQLGRERYGGHSATLSHWQHMGPAGPLEWLGFIYKLAINIWPSFILIHSFLAQMEWILNLVGQGHPHAACLALAAKLFFILQGEYIFKKRSPALLKLSAPIKNTPENVVTEPLDKEKTGSGQLKKGWKKWGREKGGRWGSQQPPEWFICQIRTQWVDYESSNKRECLGTH